MIKKVSDSNRRLQLTWFMERVLLLVKLDYMSRDNFGLILAAEQGVKFNWAFILHSRFVMDVRGVDKRKQRGVNKIAPFLFKMFSYANRNSITLILPRGHTAVKAGKGKKAQPSAGLGDDEPPSKKGKADAETEVKAEMTDDSKIEPETEVLNQMVTMGFDLKEVEERVKENWGGIMKEEMFLTPFKDIMKQSTGMAQAYQPKQKTIKIMKKKLILDPEKDVWTQAGTSDNPENFQKVVAREFQQKFTTGSAEEEFVSSERAMKGLKDSMQYFNQQEILLKSLLRKERQLQKDKRELQSALESQSFKNADFIKLEEQIEEIRQKMDTQLVAKDQQDW